MAEPTLPLPPGPTEGLHPAVARRLAALHAVHPIRVNSGHRSSEDQQLFFDCAQARARTGVCPGGCVSGRRAPRPTRRGRPTTRPCRSAASGAGGRHRVAAGNTGAMHAAAADLGLHFPIGSEPWHVQPVEVTETFLTGNPFPDEDLQRDEREAVLFVRAFLQELKDSGWFVGDILNRIGTMERRLSRL